MTGYTADTQVGRIVPGEVDTIFRPRTPRKGTVGVVLLHGQGNPEAFMDGVNQKASVRLAAALACAGIPCIAGTMHGNSWGNDPGIQAARDAGSVLKADYPLLRQDASGYVAGSMGAALGVRLSQLYPSEVAALVGLIPAYDPLAIYNYGNVGDAAMEAAWSFSGVDNFPAGLDLASHAADALGVPILTGYASNDSIVPAASVTSYHAAVGGTAGNIVNLGALDHTDAAIAAMPISQIAQFLVANGA